MPELSENVHNLVDKIADFGMEFGFKILAALVVFILGRAVIKWITKTLYKGKLPKKSDPTAVRIIENFITIGLHVLLVVSIISILGVPMASIVAVVASAGVAVGLALQGALGNLAGGIMILLFRPFRIGDMIETGEYQGKVTDVGFFYTFITTLDNKQITIPNGTVMGNSIINYSAMDKRRVDFTFGVAYGSDIERVKQILLEEADAHALVLKEPAPFARLSAQSASSLDFTLRVWCKSEDYWTVHFDLLESIHNHFVKENIEIPFDQLDVHLDK